MNQGLEKITEIKNQEKIARIYLGKERGDEFYQLTIGNTIGARVYFKDTTQRLQELTGTYIDEISEPRETLLFPGLAVHHLINDGSIKKYEIANGNYVDKKSKQLISVEKADARRETELIDIIQNGLSTSKGAQ